MLGNFHYVSPSFFFILYGPHSKLSGKLKQLFKQKRGFLKKPLYYGNRIIMGCIKEFNYIDWSSISDNYSTSCSILIAWKPDKLYAFQFIIILKI